jgi:hypothetical protein
VTLLDDVLHPIIVSVHAHADQMCAEHERMTPTEMVASHRIHADLSSLQRKDIAEASAPVNTAAARRRLAVKLVMLICGTAVSTVNSCDVCSAKPAGSALGVVSRGLGVLPTADSPSCDLRQVQRQSVYAAFLWNV